MKIENTPPSHSLESRETIGQPKKVPEISEPAAAAGQIDHVAISALGASIHSSGEARVEELKQLFEQGGYSVEADELAARLIESHESEGTPESS